MPYGIKKLLEIEAERKKRREEKARIKVEKEKMKKEERKKARKKRLTKKRNARYYAKVKSAREEYHKSMGDEMGTFSIYLMKDGKRTKFLGYRRYKVAALQLYHELLQKNNEGIQFPKKYAKAKNRIKKHIYELVLVKKLGEDETDNTTLLRNKDGKFIENYLIDAPSHKILDKNDWLIEETFHVYGFDPNKERKDFNYIYNNIILKNPSIYSRVMVYNNKLIHHYDEDFDMVICKSPSQAIELYDMIEKKTDTKKNPTIFFMGKISGSMSTWILNEIEKKTGWTRSKCMTFQSIKNES